MRGVLPFVGEAQVAEEAAEIERLAAAEVERLGDRAAAPVGAGGEAADRAAPAR
jgi:hypothetical protein